MPGEAVITGAYDLPNRYVIHRLGPIYGVDEPSKELLASCYRHALELAEQSKITSVAFPAISTGVFGYPMQQAARVEFKTLFDMLPRLSSVKHIRFTLLHHADVLIHESIIEEFIGSSEAY